MEIEHEDYMMMTMANMCALPTRDGCTRTRRGLLPAPISWFWCKR
jgi:hypothetical protein